MKKTEMDILLALNRLIARMDMDKITKKLGAAREECVKTVGLYCAQEIKDMNKLAEKINKELGD